MKNTTGKIALCLAAFAAAWALRAAPAAGGAYQTRFAKPPEAALKALRATVGKQFSAGFVFIEGKYMPPPYKVERYGTVIRINGVQVTSEVVPWNEFIKTQSGVQVTKNVQQPADAGTPEPEPVAEEPEDDSDDMDSSLDDLFDDDPSPKKKKPAPKKKKPAARPKPKKPTVTVSYSFDGEFVPNAKTKAYVERINNMRTQIDKTLRAGGYWCFGSRYSAVSGDAGGAKSLLEKLPGAMKSSSTPGAFASALANSGFRFFPESLVADLYRNKIDYVRLDERRKSEEESRKWSSVLGR